MRRAIDYMIDDLLPDGLQEESYDLSSKGVSGLLERVAQVAPDKYAAATQALGDLGRNNAYMQGESVGLQDMRPVFDRKEVFDMMDAELDDLRKAGLSPDEFKKERSKLLVGYSELMNQRTQQALKGSTNSFSKGILSGARGKAGHLQALVTTPGVYADARDEVIPMFVRHSFSEGLRPAELLAGSYGGRKSVVATKVSTAKGGDIGKLMNYTTASEVITMRDCGVQNGLDLDASDVSLRGRVLAADAAGLKAGTLLDKHAVAQIKKYGKPVIARSALTCQAERGLCAKCVGTGPGGKLSQVGDSVGATASQGISEPVVQGALCLAEGTLVRMADLKTKRIEDVRPDDWVMGSDTQGNTFPVRVIRLYDQGLQSVQRRSFAVGQTKVRLELESTAGHKILANTKSYGSTVTKTNRLTQILPVGKVHKSFGAVPLVSCKFTPGVKKARLQKVLELDGYVYQSDTFSRATLKETVELGEIPCWDIEVDHQDHLFVLANGLIVSNSTKHTGGQASGKKEFSGLGYLSQFLQVPDDFNDAAAVSIKGGMVTSIEDAPQGGKIIKVDDEEHYVPVGVAITTKVGETVEPGRPLSDGLLNPASVVEARGLGSGRRYYTERLAKILEDSGAKPEMRNVEILARAAVDTYEIEDPEEHEPFLPGDRVRSAEFLKYYKPPKDTSKVKVDNATGMYLQAPTLHYTVGTKLTPSMLDRMKRVNIGEIEVSKEAPTFKQDMQRLRTAAHSERDWMASMNTSYLKKQLQESAWRGDDTNVKSNVNFVPRLAYGEDFGKNVRETGEF